MKKILNKMYQIPQICIEILTRDDDTTGYPLTHRLLIIQTIKAVNIVIENPYLIRYWQKTSTNVKYKI